MTKSTRDSDHSPSEKDTKRKRRPAAAADPRLIRGQNVIAGIHARDQAQVRISQKIYTELSEDEQERRKQESELRELRDAVQQKYKDLRRLVRAPLPDSGNPYLFMQPFGIGDGARFFGRQETVRELLDHLRSNLTTFLNGTGKTSALQAAVLPTLLADGHLPLIVPASAEPLATSIKKQLLPNIEAMDFLNKMALAEFVRRVTDNLGGKQLYLLVDRFEALVEQPESFRDAFEADWELCVSGIAPDVHWLFAVSGSTYPLRMFKDKVAINPNLVTLGAMGEPEAHEAITGPAALRGIEIDPQVVDSILSKLSTPGVDPAQLELVCYMLAGGKGPLVKQWTIDYYTGQGEVDGILREYLDRTISDFEPTERDAAWQLLAALIDPSEKVASEAELSRKMKEFGIPDNITRRVLMDLQDTHLVEYATAYKLSSDSLLPRIQAWRDQRAARKQAEEEFTRQLRSIGGSALRGLIGGAIGFSLTYWLLPYVERVPLTKPALFFEWYFFNLTLRALVGANAGFVMILAIDLIVASFRGERSRYAIPAGMLAGALALGLAVAFHTLLRYTGNNLPLALGIGALEGMIWGVAAGAGAVWILDSASRTWLKLAITTVACGLALTVADWLLKGLDVSAPSYVIFLAGMVMPLFLIGSALLGRQQFIRGG